MLRALTAEQARAIEESAVADGISLDELMERAGSALASQIAEDAPEGKVIVLTGPGNNGGDGWVAARILHEAGRDVEVFALIAPDALSAEAGRAAQRASDARVRWRVPPGDPTAEELRAAAVLVDALLGTGSRLPLREPLPAWCRAINEADVPVVSADLPTGVDADSAAVDDAAVAADVTVTFMAPKRGLVVYPGAANAGQVVVADIGIARDTVPATQGAPEVWLPEDYARLVVAPRQDAHKNDRGRVLVVAGSGRYTGAAVLAARGAMRAGAGYVTLAVPEPIVAVAQGHLLAAPVIGMPAARARSFSSAAIGPILELAADYDAVVLGPGLTLADGAVALVRDLFVRLAKPLVVDADGLNALVDAHALLEKRLAPTVLTPHPGELARLLGVTSAEVQADRVSSSARLAEGDIAVVLKGAGTVVSGPIRQVIVTAGTPALATAGTGDVLAGVVGTLLAQGLRPLEAGALGAYLHGRAGEAAAAALTPMCVTAEDVPEYLPTAYAELLGSW